MKNHLPALLILGTTSSLLVCASCSDRSPKEPAPVALATQPTITDPARTSQPAAGSADPWTEITAALGQATRDNTADLTVPQANMDRAIDAQISAWKASGATSVPTAEEQLSLARTDFSQKVKALSLADATTWDSAKGEALSSLQKLRRVFADYLANRR